MAFWDSWSTQQKLLAAGVGGVAGLYLLTKSGGVGDSGELAIVDVRRPTDDINAIGGPAGPIGRLEVNITNPTPIGSTPGLPGVPGPPGPPGTPGRPGPGGHGRPGPGPLDSRRADIRARMMALTGMVLSLRQDGRSDWERKRISSLRERRSSLGERLSNLAIPPKPEEERPRTTGQALGPRETRGITSQGLPMAGVDANGLSVEEQIRLQLRRNGRLV